MFRSITHQLFIALLFLTSLGFSQAHAHSSSAPQHGGVVKITGEMSFELVTLDNGADVYLMYDSAEMATADMTGTMKITVDGESTSIVLEPAGGNRFSARDAVLPKGADVLIIVKEADGFTKYGAKFTIE